MSIVYDLFCVLILAVSVLIGYRRGALKTILLVISFLVAAVGAWYLSQAAAPTVYDSFVKERVISATEKSLDKENLTDAVNRVVKDSTAQKIGNTTMEFSGEELKTAAEKSGKLSDNLAELAKQKGYSGSQTELADEIESRMNAKQALRNSEIAENIPDSVKDVLEKSSDNIEDSVRDVLIAAADGTTGSTAKAVEQHLLRAPVTGVLKTILAVGFFLVLLAILRIIISFTGIINAVPIAGTINRFGGGILGLVYGAVILIIIATLLHLLIENGIAAEYINADIAEHTKVFRHFYQNSLWQ